MILVMFASFGQTILFGLRGQPIYRCAVELMVKNKNGAYGQVVFVVCCTRESIAASGDNSDEKPVWPGHIFVFHASATQNYARRAARLVNMRGNDDESAAVAIRV